MGAGGAPPPGRASRRSQWTSSRMPWPISSPRQEERNVGDGCGVREGCGGVGDGCGVRVVDDIQPIIRNATAVARTFAPLIPRSIHTSSARTSHEHLGRTSKVRHLEMSSMHGAWTGHRDGNLNEIQEMPRHRETILGYAIKRQQGDTSLNIDPELGLTQRTIWGTSDRVSNAFQRHI